MPVLPASWAAACRRSGTFDPWPVLSAIGGPDAFSNARPSDLAGAGWPPDLFATLGPWKDEAVDCTFLLAGSEAYPTALQGVPFAPPVLFVDGDPACLQRPMVAIVGTRRCTEYGRRHARGLARAVAAAGGVVVSGLAVGIDMAAHVGAMEAGHTVAVLGHGLRARGRAGHASAVREILGHGGAVTSEFPPNMPPGKHTFLQRNRIIAGLARATVVVEAPHRSGALATARQAIAAGRDLLAVPGPIGEGASEGCLDLIEQGATVVRGPATVLAIAGLKATAGGGQCPLPPAARVLQDALMLGGTVEHLAASCGMALADTLQLLVHLEVAGVVQRLPGHRYVLHARESAG